MTEQWQACGLPSFWLSEMVPLERRMPLRSSLELDVAIVGGGYSGLWTALYLSELDPSLKVGIFERETVGYGASGRNGGWVSSIFPVPMAKVSRQYGRLIAQNLAKELVETVDEIGSKVADLGIDCAFTKAGKLSLIRSPAQASRSIAEVEEDEEIGNPTSTTILDKKETESYLMATYTTGATFSGACASVQPARLVRGLATVLERRGVTIFEDSEVTSIQTGSLRVGSYRVSADKIVVATEGYTGRFSQWRRQLLPLYSMMIATDPLTDAQYEQIGSPPLGLCFADHRNLRIYGQVTSDRRIAFGGRGAPYHWGSIVRKANDVHGPTRDVLQRELIKLLPQLDGIRFVRHWGGPLGVSRDWFPRVVPNQDGKLWRIGGYAGDGVALSNLVARVTARQIVGASDKSAASTVFARQERKWEPEPFRWLGINLGLAVTRLVDELEDRGIEAKRIDKIRRILIGQE